MNVNYSKANTAYGVPASIKLTPVIKTDLKQPVSSQNPKNAQQQYNPVQCIYYPTETRKEYTALKRGSSNHIPLDKRSRSVNKTREPNSGLSLKGKGSVEKYAAYDGNASILNECDSTEDIKNDRTEHTRSRESINTQTWHGPRTSLPGKTSRNAYHASSVKARDLAYPNTQPSHFASEGTRPDSKGNVPTVASFGVPVVCLDERTGRFQSQKTTESTRRNSPFSSTKIIDAAQWTGDRSPKDARNENKSPLLTQTGTAWNKPRVQRCQSYRVGGTPGNWTSSVEMKGGDSQPWKNVKVTAETLTKNEKVGKKEEEQKNTHPNVSTKAVTGRNGCAPIVKKNPLNISSKGIVDNRLNVENYKLDKVIGQGSYAVVRLAVNKENNEKVAIKSYDKFKLNDQHKRNNVKREISILKSLDHPNVIKLYKTIDTVTQTHLIMEFPSLQSLHGYVKLKPNRRLPEEEAKKIFKQIIEGLKYLHKKNLSHRDIKLENLILDAEMNVKIIDFGFSIENPKDKTMNIFCGTPSYMAPELAAKKEYYGHLADIWAAGILLYVLLSGFFPFRDPNEKELFKKIIRGQYEFGSHVSEDAKALIKKMLRMNPLERLSAEEILQDKWITGSQSHNTNLKNYLDAKIQQYKSAQIVALQQIEPHGLRA